ncbi:TPA: hypothetical protein HA244_05675, partial [Candidatus Micrarchaeota archaeon]|nr:hypothetical protein [Candidatus Micrarchaeota archaeon]
KLLETEKIIVVSKSDARVTSLERKYGAKRINEIDAIARGARFLCKWDRMLVVNVGTGTPFVFVNGKKHSHLGGTGIGGGTLEGLAKLLLSSRPETLESIASKSSTADLSVFEVVGKRIGSIPSDATASNFGKVARKKPKKGEIATSLLRLVSESIGIMSVFAAKSCGCKRILFTGRVVAKNKTIRERLKLVMKIFNCEMKVPKDAEYCTAIGAALSAEKGRKHG